MLICMKELLEKVIHTQNIFLKDVRIEDVKSTESDAHFIWCFRGLSNIHVDILCLLV